MLAIKNVRLIDGTGAPAVDNAVILIENGVFTAAGEGVTVPEGASVINAAGLTAIPGLFDMHTHFTGSSSFDHPSMSHRTPSYDYAEAREGFLRWGVTTVRTCGDFAEEMLDFRDDAAAGKTPPCPRVLSVGPMFMARGGHPGYTVFMSDPEVLEKASVVVDDDTDIEAEVERVCAMGVDFVKAFYAHINKMNYPHPVPRLTREQLRRIIDAAHRCGKRVLVHADGCLEARVCAELGADFIEHVIGAGSENTDYTPETLDIIKRSGAVVSPTIASIAPFDNMPGAAPVMDKLRETVRRMHEMGIPLGVGCDSGIPFVPFGESVHTELELLVSCGIPECEVLRLATTGCARALGISDTAGGIVPGRDADLLLLTGDPLENITNTRKIALGMMKGRVIYQE